MNALIAHCGASLSGIGGVKRPGIVHRLDKDTSGVLVVALWLRALSLLRIAFGLIAMLSVGNLVPLKGHDLTIRALQLLPEMDLVLVGDGPERKSLAALCGWSEGLALLIALVFFFLVEPTAQQASRYSLVTSSGTIGTMTVTESGRSVDNDYRVDDNGRGLPAEEHRNVLGRFARGSSATPGGSGLGLALVAQQAQLHGGTASLEDSPLGGVRLLLRLPGPS